jgi:hypothetical protein
MPTGSVKHLRTDLQKATVKRSPTEKQMDSPKSFCSAMRMEMG